MSKRQKIIVSITGIFLVLLILVGLTYAYFLTKITGNTNTKSISVSTANLILEYGENTNVVQGISNAEPGYSVEKIFTATNKGNSTVTYGAALESIVNELSRQQDLVYTLTCTSYLKEGFSLASDGTITGTVDGTCNGVTTEKQFPSTSTMSVMTTNTIDITHTHAYKLTVTYKEMGVDQSTDMNKTFSAKVNIVDTTALTVNNPYKSDAATLKKTIIDNAMLGIGSTQFGSEVTTFTSVSGKNERVLNNAPDDYGTSYYFRGNVKDNYVTFANKTWRIVRINGDGTIRLVLDDVAKDSSGNVIETAFNSKSTVNEDNAGIGYMYGMTGQTEGNVNQCIIYDSTSDIAKVDIANTTEETCTATGGKWAATPYDATHVNVVSSTVKTSLENWYKTNIVDTNNSKYIADTLFCNDKTLVSGSENNGYGIKSTSYKSSIYSSASILNPSFECANGANNNYSRFTSNSTETIKGVKVNSDLTYPIGLLSVDEVIFAGAGVYEVLNQSYYLYNSSISSYWWLMSPELYNYVPFDPHASLLSFFGGAGWLTSSWSYYPQGLRPSLNLNNNVLVSSGDGTKENPYTVKLS